MLLRCSTLALAVTQSGVISDSRLVECSSVVASIRCSKSYTIMYMHTNINR